MTITDCSGQCHLFSLFQSIITRIQEQDNNLAIYCLHHTLLFNQSFHQQSPTPLKMYACVCIYSTFIFVYIYKIKFIIMLHYSTGFWTIFSKIVSPLFYSVVDQLAKHWGEVYQSEQQQHDGSQWYSSLWSVNNHTTTLYLSTKNETTPCTAMNQ